MPSTPTYARRRLGTELRRLRNDCHATVDAVAELCGWSRWKLIRIEAGQTSVTRHDLHLLCRNYTVAADELTRLERWLEDSRDHRWWTEYEHVIGGLEEYLSLESHASQVSVANMSAFPGLLHSQAYAYATVNASPFTPDPDIAEAVVEVRMRRQRILSGDDPTELTAVVSASLFLCETGGREVLREQIRHILEVSELPNVSVHIVPLTATAAVISGGITLFDFPDPHDPPVVYSEHPSGLVPKDGTVDVRRHRRMVDHLAKQALGPEEARAFLNARLEEL